MTVEKNRGRLERRELTATTRGVEDARWPGLAQFLRLERTTTEHGETRTTVGHAITSLPPERASPEDLLAMWRGRWEIENRTFHVLDVTFGEDHSRIRTGTAPHAMSVLRNAVLNALRTTGSANLAATLRENALKVRDTLHQLTGLTL